MGDSWIFGYLMGLVVATIIYLTTGSPSDSKASRVPTQVVSIDLKNAIRTAVDCGMEIETKDGVIEFVKPGKEEYESEN